MVKCGRYPGSLAVAALTIRWEVRCFVIGICRRIVIRRMASKAGLRRRSIVNSMMAGSTIIGYGRVRSCDHIIFAVIGKTGRSPAGCCGMPGRTIGG